MVADTGHERYINHQYVESPTGLWIPATGDPSGAREVPGLVSEGYPWAGGGWQSIDVTRPGDITTYTVGDVFQSTPAYPLVLRDVTATPGGNFCITSAGHFCNNQPATKANFNVQFFDAPVAVQDDNVPFACSWAEAKTLLGSVSLTGFAWLTGWSFSLRNSAGYWVWGKCAEGDTNLYFVPILNNAYIPAAWERFQFRFLIREL